MLCHALKSIGFPKIQSNSFPTPNHTFHTLKKTCNQLHRDPEQLFIHHDSIFENRFSIKRWKIECINLNHHHQHIVSTSLWIKINPKSTPKSKSHQINQRTLQRPFATSSPYKFIENTENIQINQEMESYYQKEREDDIYIQLKSYLHHDPSIIIHLVIGDDQIQSYSTPLDDQLSPNIEILKQKIKKIIQCIQNEHEDGDGTDEMKKIGLEDRFKWPSFSTSMLVVDAYFRINKPMEACQYFKLSSKQSKKLTVKQFIQGAKFVMNRIAQTSNNVPKLDLIHSTTKRKVDDEMSDEAFFHFLMWMREETKHVLSNQSATSTRSVGKNMYNLFSGLFTSAMMIYAKKGAWHRTTWLIKEMAIYNLTLKSNIVDQLFSVIFQMNPIGLEQVEQAAFLYNKLVLHQVPISGETLIQLDQMLKKYKLENICPTLKYRLALICHIENESTWHQDMDHDKEWSIDQRRDLLNQFLSESWKLAPTLVD